MEKHGISYIFQHHLGGGNALPGLGQATESKSHSHIVIEGEIPPTLFHKFKKVTKFGGFGDKNIFQMEEEKSHNQEEQEKSRKIN